MSDQFDQFDDPALKEAVRRAFPRESAPAALRQRVAAIMASGTAAAEDATDRGGTRAADRTLRRPDRSWWSRQFTAKTAVAAAAALVAIGVMVIQIRSAFAPPPAGGYAATSFPQSFALAMVRTHDNCAKLPDHHLVPGTDPAVLKASLSASEGIAVAAVDLGPGWQFKGAGLCTVDGSKAAHLLFTHGSETISVFSLPTPPSCARASGKYTETVEGHPIAGVVTNGAVYCVVGSGAAGLTPHDLEPLLEKVRADVTPRGCGSDAGPGGTTIARG
jgi:hypothetical protein